jgi:hydroxyethylthiazole kinase-like uncharacterized protein yjeF
MPIQSTSLDALRKLLRSSDSHKGNYGSVAVIGGAEGMVGAALLAGRAAIQLGAGKVWLGLIDKCISVDPIQPELMLYSANTLLKNYTPTQLLIGPGLGQSPAAHQLLKKLLQSNTPLIIDADGLNLIARHAHLQHILQQRSSETLLTPHPAEAARLLACSTADIQNNRINAIQHLGEHFKCHIILKGHETLIYAPNEQDVLLNQTGNPALSSAGQGDILGGLILALWAQGLTLLEASACGVHLHGKVADTWRQSQSNAIGLTASETSLLARAELNKLLSSFSF